MSAKTTGEEDSSCHEFFNMDGTFLAEIAPYLRSDDKVPLVYEAIFADKERSFIRNKLVPRAALERARHDQLFCYNFCHAIAVQYEKEMLESDHFDCTGGCGQTATRMFLAPMAMLEEEPPKIIDFLAKPLCGGRECLIKAKSGWCNVAAGLTELTKKMAEEGLVDGSAGMDVNESGRSCLQCGKISNKLKRCSRCKSAYFCDEDCQQRAWKRHKKDCQAPPAQGASAGVVTVEETKPSPGMQSAEKSSDERLDMDYWFKVEGNLSGDRYNIAGDYIPQTDGVDWENFEKTLDEKPKLAFAVDGQYGSSARIILHCLTAYDPDAPLSVIRKLITINPENLFTRWGPCDDGPGWNVLQSYLSMHDDEGDFEICKALVEARPELLLEEDGYRESGYDTLKKSYPKEAEKLYNELKQSGRLDDSKAAVAAINREVMRRVEEDDIVR